MNGQSEGLKVEVGVFSLMNDGIERSGKDAFALLEKNSIHHWTNRPAMTKLSGTNTPKANVEPLTIFYGGKVFVYDGIPEQKVREIMVMAATSASLPKAVAADGELLARSLSLQSTNAVPISKNAMNNPCLSNFQAELPIARRHSLQRFLEKRRDRVVNKSPYSKAEGDEKKSIDEGEV